MGATEAGEVKIEENIKAPLNHPLNFCYRELQVKWAGLAGGIFPISQTFPSPVSLQQEPVLPHGLFLGGTWAFPCTGGTMALPNMLLAGKIKIGCTRMVWLSSPETKDVIMSSTSQRISFLLLMEGLFSSVLSALLDINYIADQIVCFGRGKWGLPEEGQGFKTKTAVILF